MMATGDCGRPDFLAERHHVVDGGRFDLSGGGDDRSEQG
jgi:hypothetical protein